MKPKFLVAIAALALAACSHAGITPSVPHWRTAPMTFRVVVPSTSPAPAKQARRPQYISPATQSVSFTLTSYDSQAVTVAPVVVALTGSNCSGSPKVCEATSSEPVGSDAFTVSTFASTDGSVRPLSTATDVNASITAAGPNNVGVTLGGVVSQLAFSPAAASTVNGTASAGAVALNVEDASGDIIVGPGSYTQANGSPDTVALSCQPHLTLETTGGATANTTIDTPQNGVGGSNDLTQIAYDGTAIGGSSGGTLTCTASDAGGALPATFSLTLSATGSVTWTVQ